MITFEQKFHTLVVTLDQARKMVQGTGEEVRVVVVLVVVVVVVVVERGAEGGGEGGGGEGSKGVGGGGYMEDGGVDVRQ